jgi:hypothetical protein
MLIIQRKKILRKTINHETKPNMGRRDYDIPGVQSAG